MFDQSRHKSQTWVVVVGGGQEQHPLKVCHKIDLNLRMDQWCLVDINSFCISKKKKKGGIKSENIQFPGTFSLWCDAGGQILWPWEISSTSWSFWKGLNWVMLLSSAEVTRLLATFSLVHFLFWKQPYSSIGLCCLCQETCNTPQMR